MRILYFAWVRERIGIEGEDIDLPVGITTVAELAAFLGARGEGYAHAFENPRIVRAALDRRHAKPDTPLDAAREIAFFPPMTGG